MAIQNLEVTTESILSAVVRMPESEVEQLFKTAKQLKKREAELIDMIKQTDLSTQKKQIYRKLLKNFRAEKISPEEYKQLTEITEELETISAKRLEWLYEISKMRQQPIGEIMKELEIKPKNYG